MYVRVCIGRLVFGGKGSVCASIVCFSSTRVYSLCASIVRFSSAQQAEAPHPSNEQRFAETFMADTRLKMTPACCNAFNSHPAQKNSPSFKSNKSTAPAQKQSKPNRNDANRSSKSNRVEPVSEPNRENKTKQHQTKPDLSQKKSKASKKQQHLLTIIAIKKNSTWNTR